MDHPPPPAPRASTSLPAPEPTRLLALASLDARLLADLRCAVEAGVIGIDDLTMLEALRRAIATDDARHRPSNASMASFDAFFTT